jgi:hypothetical protein
LQGAFILKYLYCVTYVIYLLADNGLKLTSGLLMFLFISLMDMIILIDILKISLLIGDWVEWTLLLSYFLFVLFDLSMPDI